MAKKEGLGIKIKRENIGKFTAYCKSQGYSSGSAPGCIAKAKKSKSAQLRKRAIFSQNAKKWKH